VDHRIVLSLDGLDFGRTTKNADELSPDWTDRLGLTTKCRENGAPFYVVLSFNPDDAGDALTVCPASGADFRRKRAPAVPPKPGVPQNVTQHIFSSAVGKNKAVFESTDLENEVLKPEDRSRLTKLRKNGLSGKSRVELVLLYLTTFFPTACSTFSGFVFFLRTKILCANSLYT
jgi:hypothetical protein